MKCMYCGCTESRVVDSRPTEDGAIRRRRECERCQKRYGQAAEQETESPLVEATVASGPPQMS